MKRLATLALLALGSLGSWMPNGAHATAAGLPARLYPPGAHVTYRPVLANAEMDCMWNSFCEGGIPLFHVATQEQLHRIGGWGQFAAVWHKGQVKTAFELFASSYESNGARHWSVQAFADFHAAVAAHGYSIARQQSLLLRVTSGRCLQAVEPGSGSDDKGLTVMACWSGNSEVEAIAMYPHHSRPSARTALTDLARQVTAAMSTTI